jgi:hypothetical protein
MEQAHLKPKGTIAILIIFALTIVLLWASAYVALLFRGAAR